MDFDIVGSWSHQVAADLGRLGNMLHRKCPVECPTDIHAWVEFVSSQSALQRKALIATAKKYANSLSSLNVPCRIALQELNNVAHSVGLQSDLIDPENLSSAPGPPTAADLEEHHGKVEAPHEEVAHFLCYDCGESFPTALSLGRHRRSKHKVRRLGFSYAGEDGMCNVCGTLYHDRRRLVQHLNYSSKQCLAGYIAHGKPFSDDDIVALYRKLKKLCKGQPRIAGQAGSASFWPRLSSTFSL